MPKHRRGGFGNGFFHTISNIVDLPVFALVLSALFLVTNLSSAITSIANGGKINYSAETFNNYVNAQYTAEFGESSAYEDNLLIVFLTDQSRDGYYAMALVGDNVAPQIRQMFGNERTEFWNTLEESMTEYYKFSVQKGFRVTLEKLAASISEKKLASSFVTDQDHSGATASHVTNYSNLSINEDSVNIALKVFTESTGIPTVMVIDTADNVFGRRMPVKEIVISLVTASIVAFSTVAVVKNTKKSRALSSDGAKTQKETNN